MDGEDEGESNAEGGKTKRRRGEGPKSGGALIAPCSIFVSTIPAEGPPASFRSGARDTRRRGFGCPRCARSLARQPLPHANRPGSRARSPPLPFPDIPPIDDHARRPDRRDHRSRNSNIHAQPSPHARPASVLSSSSTIPHGACPRSAPARVTLLLKCWAQHATCPCASRVISSRFFRALAAVPWASNVVSMPRILSCSCSVPVELGTARVQSILMVKIKVTRSLSVLVPKCTRTASLASLACR